MKRSALTLLLAACVPLGVPARPGYDGACTPSHDAFLELATSRRDWPRIDAISDRPGLALAEAHAEIERLGLQLRLKPTTSTELDGMSTTLPGVVWLAADWHDKPVAEQAWTLWHEAAHGRQYQRLGAARFFALYAVPEGRWALEVAAYAFSFQVQLRLGVAPATVLARIEHKAERLRPEYRLREMPACTVETTATIWRDAAGL